MELAGCKDNEICPPPWVWEGEGPRNGGWHWHRAHSMDHMDVREQIISLSNGSIDRLEEQDELEEDSQGHCQIDQSKL